MMLFFDEQNAWEWKEVAQEYLIVILNNASLIAETINDDRSPPDTESIPSRVSSSLFSSGAASENFSIEIPPGTIRYLVSQIVEP